MVASGAQEGQENVADKKEGFDYSTLFRLLVIWFAIQFAFRSSKKAVGPDHGAVISAPGNNEVVEAPVVHQNLWQDGDPFELRVFASTERKLPPDVYKAMDEGSTENNLLWYAKELQYVSDLDREVNITVPHAFLQHLIANGSVFAHVFFDRVSGVPFDEANKGTLPVLPVAKDRRGGLPSLYAVHQLNVYKKAPKVHGRKNLLSGKYSDERVSSMEDVITANAAPTAFNNFWRPKLHLRLVHDFTQFAKGHLPADIYSEYNFVSPSHRYFPPHYLDRFWCLSSSHSIINNTVTSLPLTITYSPITFMKWRMQSSMEQSWKQKEQSGFGGASEKEQEELKRMLLETNPYLLAVTGIVSFLHMIFDCLAFKNDISFWKSNKSMKGLSSRSMLLSSVSQVVIFLYLCDNDTSWVILFSSGVGLLIEFWKIRKAVTICVSSSAPFVSFRSKLTEDGVKETETEKYDKEAMVYLSYALYPLMLAYAVYSLVYDSYKSWYSWVLGSLVGCVYTFGFIMMCPQLYLNYKLKSVAHLPWRMLTYKALNTFIDDLFSFVITMPTLHRLSCFRDDVIFFIFLYQKWIYQVDYTRANEFGLTPVAEPSGNGSELQPVAEPANGDDNDDNDNDDHDDNSTKTSDDFLEKSTDVRQRKSIQQKTGL